MKVLMYRFTLDEDGKYPYGKNYVDNNDIKRDKEDMVGGIYEVIAQGVTFYYVNHGRGVHIRSSDCAEMPEGNVRVMKEDEVLSEGDFFINSNEELEIVRGLAGTKVEYMHCCCISRADEPVFKRKSKFIVPLDLLRELA